MNKSSLKLNAILNGLKQCFGIIFPLITFPYVSRVLGDDGFGKYSFAWSIVSYFVLIAGFGISSYAIREGARIRDDRVKLNSFCSEIFTINIVTTVISLCMLLLITVVNYKIRQYLPYIMILSTSIILNLLGRDWINSIYEDYLYITIRYLVIQIVSVCLMLCLIKSSEDVWKYCVVAVIASFGGNIPNFLYLRRYVNTNFVKKPRYKKHLPPMLVFFVTQIAITIYVNADITMLGFYTNDSAVGIYSLSSKIYSLIKTVINAMVVVTLPRMTYIIEHSPNIYKKTLEQISSYLMIILLPISCGTFMLSREVILIVGGDAYQSGSLSLRILSFAMIFAVLCTFVMNSILIANRKEHECMKATAISAASNVFLNLGAIPLWGMTGAAITTIIAEMINLLILIKSAQKLIGPNLFDFKNSFQSAISCLPIVLICLGVKKLCIGTILSFIMSFICSMFGYAIMLLIMRNRYIVEILLLIKRSLKRG